MVEDAGELYGGNGWYWHEHMISGLACTFKAGDRVVGNREASKHYGITKEGWRGTVTGVYGDAHIKVRGPGIGCVMTFDVNPACFDLDKTGDKIVITVDGKTTLARLYSGKDVVKSAEAKCSPDDVFDFAVGAKLAMDRLLGGEEKQGPKFNKADLQIGRFGRMSNGDWFVIVEDRFIYDEGGFDLVVMVDDDGGLMHKSIDCIVKARSFRNAKDVAAGKIGNGGIVWSRPGVKFE